MSKWNKPTDDITFTADVINIWQTRLDLPEKEIKNYQTLLSKDEQIRSDMFTFAGKQKEFTITRGLLRKILGQLVDIDPVQLQIAYSDKDKPFLIDKYKEQTVSFNVSHSHDIALIAITLEHRLGIDVEKIRTNVELEKLAKRFFSAQEYNDLNTYPEAELPKAFYACWTRKEAFVKALGKGISFGLSEFSVSVDPDEQSPSLITHWDEGESNNWSIVNIEMDKEYIVALAVEGNNMEINYWK